MSAAKGPALTVGLCLVIALSTMLVVGNRNVERRQVRGLWLAESRERESRDGGSVVWLSRQGRLGSRMRGDGRVRDRFWVVE